MDDKTEREEGRGPEVEKAFLYSRGRTRLEVINVRAKSIERWHYGQRIRNQRCKTPFQVMNQTSGTMCSTQSRTHPNCNGGFCWVKRDDSGNTPT